MRIENLRILIAAVVFVCSSCGRKSNTIYQFDRPTEKKITKLSLPAVRGTHVILEKDGNVVTWQPVDQALVGGLAPKATPIGYHVYRFFAGGGVPHKPITKKPIQETFFKDTCAKPACYLVRCVFRSVHDTNVVIVGPAGQSVCSFMK